MDLLKGASIKKHYDDIEFIMEKYNSPQAAYRRKELLEALMVHVKKTVPYYKNITNLNELKNFPVVNKNIIRDYFEEFKSDAYHDEKLYSRYTSGSTGTPFRIYYNRNKKNRNTADTLYFANRSGYKVGQKLVYIRHWDQYNSKDTLSSFLQNILMHPVSKLSDSDIQGLMDKIAEDPSPKSILGYASALTTICNYLESKKSPPINANVKSVIAMSEYLSAKSKEQIKYYFGVEGLSRYSNVENGILAQQFPGGTNFHINWASYFIEILKPDEDVPVAPGKPGRIVVTDFYNYSMPLIRYDTGDIGCMGIEDSFNGAPYLERIEGRKMDMIYNTKGELITSYVTYHLLKYPKIKQFQFIQENSNTYLFKLNVYDDFDMETEMIDEFKTHLGESAIIKVKYVNDIPLLLSGKRKLVINKMLEKQKGEHAIDK
ncbi:CoF synthetase [Galbibacter pacificus]|uniref:CoF synthetase n=1 Tax=Galbibacter pacificus TaxID=2996052 RepID=A0ABT6FUU0_9FLAO|nr:CoF synthetase [Galbibacter pacificus]MDG3583499.1 CoF synthetase [Galbibacter pacificus]MDG3587024.1 CoF synthetase [Galbibacter pacificus]